jgi:hypothetical protein
MSVIGILALHSMVEFPLWYANFLGIAALVLGAGAAGERGIGVQLGRPAVLGAVVVLGGMTLATSLGAYRGVERLFVGPAGEALPSVLVHESHKVETRSLFVPYVEFAYAGLLRADGAADPEALALNARALRFLPADHVAYRQVLLLAQAGEAAPAQALLRRAAAVYPQFLPRFEAVLERLAEQAPAPFEPLRAALNTTGG